jgi:uncharacterized membrane protein YebE (DUF533 family)
MDPKAILSNLLDTSQTATRKGLEIAEEKLGVPESGPERDAMLGGLGKGALAGTAVALLLGTKGGRNLTGTALKVGGVAAVGGLAYKAYNQWQQQQGGNIRDTGTPIAELQNDAADARSEAIVKAMIAAAKSDGHMDAEEQKLITSKIESLNLETDITSFLMTELTKPLDVAEIAASADSPEAAAEIYLASAMVVDLGDEQERQYMNSLAKSLGLEAAVVQNLEGQIA